MKKHLTIIGMVTLAVIIVSSILAHDIFFDVSMFHGLIIHPALIIVTILLVLMVCQQQSIKQSRISFTKTFGVVFYFHTEREVKNDENM